LLTNVLLDAAVGGIEGEGGHEMRSRPIRFLSSRRVAAALAATAMAALLVPASASASPSPVLEFATPSKAFPVHFTTESGAVKAELAGFNSVVHCAASQGEGEITGPRSTVSHYSFTGCVTEGATKAKCKSAGAKEEEIVSEKIESELVYIDQAKDEVGMLMNAGGGVYMAFACGGELVVATGSFVAPVSPLNTETTSFTATLSESQSVQIPDAYENASGVVLHAIPFGQRGSHEAVPTGVEATIVIHPSVPVTVRAVTTAQMEAKQREEARQEEAKRTEAVIAKLREEAAADKQREESLSAQIAALEMRLKAKPKAPTRAQLLAKALKQCKRQPPSKRGQCRAAAERRYGGAAGKHKSKK
jgi:hypothetical protein